MAPQLAPRNKMPMKAIIYIELETLHEGNTVFIGQVNIYNRLKSNQVFKARK